MVHTARVERRWDLETRETSDDMFPCYNVTLNLIIYTGYEENFKFKHSSLA